MPLLCMLLLLALLMHYPRALLLLPDCRVRMVSLAAQRFIAQVSPDGPGAAMAMAACTRSWLRLLVHGA